MARILRGDVIWANLDPTIGQEQRGKRPVLVLSHDIFNEKSGTVIAMALTTQPQRVKLPLAYELQYQILNKPVWVKISQIRILSSKRLGDIIGRVSEMDLEIIVNSLNEIIG